MAVAKIHYITNERETCVIRRPRMRLWCAFPIGKVSGGHGHRRGLKVDTLNGTNRRDDGQNAGFVLRALSPDICATGATRVFRPLSQF